MNLLRTRLLLVPILGLAGLVSGCSSQPSIEAVAQCIADSASPGEIAGYGEDLVRKGSITLKRWATVGCKDGLSVALNKESRKAVGDHLATLLVPNPEFRAGAFSAQLPDGATFEQRRAIASLGLKLEDFATRREEALNCLQAPEPVLLMMADADMPFATAVIGSRAGVSEPAHARAIAGALLNQVSQTASLKRTESCAGQKDTEFREYAAEVDSFMQGNHPWAPGCRAVVDDHGTTLSCTGAPAATP